MPFEYRLNRCIFISTLLKCCQMVCTSSSTGIAERISHRIKHKENIYMISKMDDPFKSVLKIKKILEEYKAPSIETGGNIETRICIRRIQRLILWLKSPWILCYRFYHSTHALCKYNKIYFYNRKFYLYFFYTCNFAIFSYSFNIFRVFLLSQN